MSTPKVVLITGGTGFAGSHLAELLSLAPDQYELHLTHVTPVPPSLTDLLPSVQFHQLDLTNSANVSTLIETIQPDQIYQLASIPVVGNSFERASEIFSANTAVVHNLLEAVRLRAPSARVVVVTSAEVYGTSITPSELPISEEHSFRPVNPYGISKVTQDLLADCYTRAYSLQIVRVRPFNHVGERQQPGFAISDFARQIVAIERGTEPVLHVGNLSSERDFTDVKDMVKGYKTIMESGVVGEAYNLGSGTAVTMQSVVDQLIALAQADIRIEQDQNRLRPSDVPIMVANTAKANALGWKSEIPLSQTLLRILGYWRGL